MPRQRVWIQQGTFANVCRTDSPGALGETENQSCYSSVLRVSSCRCAESAAELGGTGVTLATADADEVIGMKTQRCRASITAQSTAERFGPKVIKTTNETPTRDTNTNQVKAGLRENEHEK